MLTFGEISTNVAKILQRSEDESFKTDIGAWINIAHEYLYNIYDYWIELQDTYNFSTVDGTESYFMPNYFGKPLRIYDLTNKKPLTIQTEEEYTDSNISNVANAVEEASPSIIRFYGVSGSQVALSSSGSIVKVKSSSTADVGKVVRIEGYIDSSLTIIDFENITLGTPSTTFVSGTKTFYQRPRSISKSGDTDGYITIANSASATVAIMTSVDRVLRHKVAKIGRIPSQTNSMRILYKKRVLRLVNTYDYPFTDADGYLTYRAAALGVEQEKEQPERSSFLNNMAQDELKAILVNQQSKLGPSFQHKMVSSFAQAHRS